MDLHVRSQSFCRSGCRGDQSDSGITELVGANGGLLMATIERSDTATRQLRFCPECGHPADEGRFCSVCGHSLDAVSAKTSEKRSGSPARSRGALIAAGAAVGLAAVAVAVIILLTGSSGSTSTANASSVYKQKLAAALAPVVAADQRLSGALTSLDGSPRALKATQNAVSQAQSALVAAHGALAVLTVPSTSSTLSQQAQQALTAVSGYDDAVSATLSTPVGPNASQLQTLATGAQSALITINPVAPGAGNSVTGTSNLLNWANGANALAKRQTAAAQRRSQQAQQRASQPAAVSTTPAGSPQGLTACDQNISVNSATSCAFADNVFAQYASAVQAASGPLSTDVTAASPATGATYTDNCQFNSSTQIVLCSHGTDLIQFPEWAAAVYNG